MEIIVVNALKFVVCGEIVILVFAFLETEFEFCERLVDSREI